jgi:signal transduction histidine kinase
MKLVLLLLVITAIGILFRIFLSLKRIVKAIHLYQGGQEMLIPRIGPRMLFGGSNGFYKIAETLHFISDRLRHESKLAHDERNEKDAILETLSEGVLAVDGQFIVRTINYTASKMIGVPRHQILGKKLSPELSNTKSDLLKTSCSILMVCLTKRIVVTDSLCVDDGKKIFLDLIAAPKPQHPGAVLILQDKSNHHKVLEMGKDFVANASHELRTPITIIKGFAETLQDLSELPRDMVVDITEKIVRNCQRMDNLVKNLLTLADLENLPDSHFQQCDLVALAETCGQVVSSVYQTAQIAIEKNKESICVAADPDILELAILNILDNAAKYSAPPAHITLHLSQIGDQVNITISDKGIGIPPADLEQIFERFYTVDKARSRRLGGAGLGLSIVRTIIEKHHGTISVASAVGEGTSFLIQLPSS